MRIVITVSILVFGGILFSGCDASDPVARPTQEAPLEVSIVHPHYGEIYRFINLPGEVRPLFEVTLFAKVDGYLSNLRVDKGDPVRAGDLIADIDVPELRANRVKYRAEVELAEAEFKQISELPTNNPVNATPGEIEAAKNRLAVAKGRLAVAKGNLEYTESMLNYARVTAPFDGVITKRFVDPGAYIPVPNAADTPEAAAIVTVTDFKTLRLQVAVPETEVPYIQLGQPIRWTTDDYPGRCFDGTVTRAYWALDRATRTMLTEAQMTNSDMLLRPGMLVNARIALQKREHALLVPAAAVVKEKSNVFVFVVNADKATKVAVQAGFADGINVEIRAGIETNAALILSPPQTLRDNEKVTLVCQKNSG